VKRIEKKVFPRACGPRAAKRSALDHACKASHSP
jgi:hypothetical protein